MPQVPYAGAEYRRRRERVKLDPRPPNRSVAVLRRLRAWAAGTPDMTPADLLDKIDDLIFQETPK